MRAVCVIGLGLIGGSVLRAAARAGRPVWGATASSEDREAAVADGFTVLPVEEALAKAAEADALVVLAVPLPAVDEVLRTVASVAPSCLLTDVVSVKSAVASAVARRAPGVRYAGGHPMAGRSASGWAAGSADLFDGAPWVVATDEEVPAEAWRAAVSLALGCGAHVVPTTSGEHDAAVARISHLPHVLAAVLAATGADGGPLALSLAAGSFADGTRVAGTRAELVLAMCEGNREQLLDAVDDALGRLGAARGALASTGGLAATIRAGNEARAGLVALRETPREELRIDLTDPEAFEDLRSLGSGGGRILRLEGDIAIADLPD
ncbi:prephenate dehydrogenase [Actinophytocola sp. S1-96]|uniref:Prephenate dehydrogenase n=1 Tax=Actinophytocola gossypii TaxID=2812003 RepID=A0ABT2J573_9PSEU|nr:prephenate dehydrogenase [Actinophytocola gossypii]MCT2582414.1 prephenate dehydrogenase [Actinophytocola gossypii]